MDAASATLVAPPVISAERRRADLLACREAIRHGSRSFHAASKLLPRRVREPALALYAFCRLADDAVDEVAQGDKARAVDRLRRRLDAVYAGRPADHPADRAMAAVVEGFEMPRPLPEALIEGMAWDAQGRTYADLSDLHAYAARVAGAVGAMMTVLMGVRHPGALARACDLGNAMQLTNIARDVGEDARAGRLFLPRDWLEGAGIDPDALLADPRCTPALAGLTGRLLDEADRLYRRAAPGVAALPLDCRPAIHAAARIYRAIGGRVRAAGCDSISRRAVTGKGRKLALTAAAVGDAGLGVVTPWSRLGLRAPPLPECAFLVAAAAKAPPARPTARSEAQVHAFIDILAQLEARDRSGAGPGTAAPLRADARARPRGGAMAPHRGDVEPAGRSDGEAPLWGDGEAPRWSDGEAPRWGGGEAPRWGDGEAPRWGDDGAGAGAAAPLSGPVPAVR